MSDRIQPTPECMAMVVCERVETDPTTGRLNLLGLVLATHPGVQDLAVYIDLVGGHGDYVVRLDLIHATSGERRTLPVSGRVIHLDRGNHFISTLRGKGIGFDKTG